MGNAKCQKSRFPQSLSQKKVVARMRLRFRFRSWRQMLRLRIRFSAQRAGCHPITKGLNRHHWSKATTSTEGRDVKGQDEVPPLEQQLLRYQCDGRSKRSKGNRMAQVTTKGNGRISQILCYLHVTQTFSMLGALVPGLKAFRPGRRLKHPCMT